MRLISFHDWIRRIYATQDDELDCDELSELLPTYVDREITGSALPLHASEIEHHLQQCPYCYDLYVALRDVAMLEHRETVSVSVPVQRRRSC
jgi:predicted anti-sigma-YlaC factor YlaD